MNTLLAKEVRLVRPAYIMALVLAVVPMWLLTNGAGQAVGSTDIYQVVAAYPSCFGLVLLALSCFGREFSLNTFPVLLAQPLERQRIWRTKIAVLATAMITIFVVWSASWVMRVLFLHAAVIGQGAGEHAIKVFDSFLFAFVGTAALAAFSGGLWTTLLLRQVTAPFWFTVLLPATVVMVVDVCGGNTTAIFVALALYSIAGFWLARRLFFSAQETAWTGGIFVLPGLQSKDAAKISENRSRRPWVAFIRKEFQLHQVGLAGIAILFVVHLGTLLFHHGGTESKIAKTASTVSDLCSFLWCVAPLFIGATSVAEERKMGMMEHHLCLPISNRAQVAIKLFFVVLLGGLLSGLLFWTRIKIGHSMAGMSDYVELKLGDRVGSLTILSGLCTGLAFLAFYGSSLSRNLMQALVSSVAAMLVIFGLTLVASPDRWSRLANYLPWEGALPYFIGTPTFAVAIIWLGYRNFRQLPETARLWRRNAIGWSCALLFAGTATAGLFNRAWEFLTPLEPAHGRARLSISDPPALRGGSQYLMQLYALLPDGLIWQTRIGRHPSWGFNLADTHYSLGIGGKWSILAEHPMVVGSNWVDAAAGYRDTAAIRSDGTLWVSEKPRSRFTVEPGGRLHTDPPDTLVQHGNDADWKSVIPIGGTELMLLLKTDGSLWRWDSRGFDWHKPWEGMRDFQPFRLGTNSNWAKIMITSGDHAWGDIAWIFAWDTSGETWALTNLFNSFPTNKPKNELAPGKGLERMPMLDNRNWRGIAEWAPQGAPFEVGLRDDGTLWIWEATLHGYLWLPKEFVGKISQLGHETNWVSVTTSTDRTLVALRSDGTLWRWDRDTTPWIATSQRQLMWPAEIQPARMGTHSDWVAVCSAMFGIVSVAADGSLWYWSSDVEDYWSGGRPLIMASRKPTRFGNIFDKE